MHSSIYACHLQRLNQVYSTLTIKPIKKDSFQNTDEITRVVEMHFIHNAYSTWPA